MLILKYLPEISGVLIFMMMATQLPSVGKYLILIEFALVGLLLLRHTKVFLDAAVRWWPVMLAPILAVISTLWSEMPMVSLRYGTQFLFTAFTGVLLARLLTPKRFVCAFMVAMFLFCIGCIISGRGGPSAEGWVLIGLTGSKNQLGYAAQGLLMAGLAVLMMRNIAAPLRWIAIVSIPLGAYLVLGSNAATALITAAAGCAVIGVFWIGQRLQPGGRLAAILGCALIMTPLVALAPEIERGINHFIYDTLDKSPTLTGRTDLWAVADDLVSRRPIQGYGYQAIWLGESTDTIALMRMTGQDGRMFHFHDQYRQIAVDTGWIGLSTFIALVVFALIVGVRQFLLYPSMATSFLFVTLVLYVVRGFFDVMLGPFSLHSLLFYSTVVYAFWRPQEAEAAAEPALNWRRRLRPA